MNAPFKQTAAKSDARWSAYVASVRAEIVTQDTPEAVEWMADHAASFADFCHDECVYSPELGAYFLNNDDGILEDVALIASWEA